MAKKIFWFILCLLFVSSGFAEEFRAKGRIFIGSNSSYPTELNQEMAQQNIKEFKVITKYGVDITYALNSYLDIGLRYERINQNNLEAVPTAGQSYQATLTQDAVLGVARTTFLKTEVFRADVFGGLGVSKTDFSIRNATQDGQLSTGDFKNVTAKAGASIGAGYKKVFFFFEGGYDYNRVSSGLQRTGNINNAVTSLDLSGSYILIGILFDDIMARK